MTEIFKIMTPGPAKSDLKDLQQARGNDAVRSVIRDAFAPKKTNIDDIFKDLILTSEDVQSMADSEFWIPDMLVKGHVSAWPAPANAGKTTIFVNYVCPELVTAGAKVIYVNADAAPDALKSHFAHAERHGYVILAPDAKQGMGVSAVIDKLKMLSESGADLTGTVFILDTLKKFCDMLQKNAQKAFLSMVRSLSTKGATIILLAHTNKHTDLSGKTIFEGTVDLRNDVDELIYLDVFDNEAKKVIEVTTRPDKVRAKIRPVSFTICKDTREVKRLDEVIPVIASDERETIAAIISAIKGKLCKKEEIVEEAHCKAHISRPKIRASLEKNSQGANPFFKKEDGFENNAKLFTLTERGMAF
jgi:hypothetical protein